MTRYRQWAVTAAAYVPISILCGYFYCSLAPSPDQSLYDYIAWQGLHGVQWYVGSLDMSWPGSFVIHEIGIRLFGAHRWVARLTDFILLQPAILAMYLFLRSARLDYAALIIVLAYPLIYVTSGGWMAGHRDIVAMHLLIGSSAILLAYRRHPRISLFCSGLLVGYAVMLRPTYLAFAPALLAVSVMQLEIKSIKPIAITLAVLSIGILTFPLIFLVAGLITHTFNAWLEAQGFALHVYQVADSRWRLVSQLVSVPRDHFLWLSATAIAGGMFWLLTLRLSRHAMLLFGMVLTALISFVVQNKGFGYHLGGLIPLFTVAALGGVQIALTHKYRRSMFRISATSIALASLLILCGGLERRTQNNLLPFAKSLSLVRSLPDGSLNAGLADDGELKKEEVISIIQGESNEQDRFYQWGWLYDVAFRSKRLSASRFVAAQLLALVTEDMVDYRPWFAAFDTEMTLHKPKFILLDLTTLPKGASLEGKIHLPEGSGSIGLSLLVQHLNRSYSVRRQWSDQILFERLEQ
jgi:hypothetical protein